MDKRNPDISKRSRLIKNGARGDGPVVYWMSRDQRTVDNWALLWAQQEAMIRGKGLVVVFCLVDDYPSAREEHYAFLLEGLKQVKDILDENNISFLILNGQPPEVLPHFLYHINAHLLVCDFDPLRIKQRWQTRVTEAVAIPVFEVDTHNILPAWVVSDKKEYAAYTIRPKINRLLDEFLTPIPALEKHPVKWRLIAEQFTLSSVDERVAGHPPVKRSSSWPAGEIEALQAVDRFIRTGLPGYAEDRNNPCLNGQSGLSPYLHFGHLAAHRVALLVSNTKCSEESKEAFLEELIVRKELADNYCYYEKNYDQFSAFPNWAKETLNTHRRDKRSCLYSFEQFEQGLTHEKLWNACQLDLVNNSKLHGFLRMYWAKKILEWTPDPETALEYAITLNDRYSLDGRDPNGYAGIAWAVGGVHDRAWQEREVFGKVRYMNEAGCRRKFKTNEYIESVFGSN